MQVRRTPADVSLAANDTHYASTVDAIRKIVQEEGFLGLYSGINGSLIGVVSTNFAYFYWYSVVRNLYLSSQDVVKPPGTATELSLGAVAGAIAQVFTIPVSVVTTRQQTQPIGDKKGLIDTGREVIRSEDGWTGLWRGLKASLVLVINPSITYGAYQRLRIVFFPGKASLRPWQAFCGLHKVISAEILAYGYSPRCTVQGPCDHCNTTFNCRQSMSPVTSTSGETRKAF